MPSGSELTLSVSAITPNPPLRYQWQRMGIDIAGATNKTFTLSSAHAADTGLYTVLVSDTVIVIPTTSEVARLDWLIKKDYKPQ